MTGRIVIRPRAEQDMDEQADYIARNDLAAASGLYHAVEETLHSLLRMPEVGRLWRPRIPRFEGIRVWRIRGYERHLIFYRVQEDTIEVVRVLYGTQDIECILDTGLE